SLTGGIFRIEGRGIGKRFLRLRNNTTLDIGDNTVELLEGLAEYGNYAKISVGQGEAFISNMELKTGGQFTKPPSNQLFRKFQRIKIVSFIFSRANALK
uniref:hypothetical protein n=1 Tax=Phaeodactylibacter xiamenensis TaxID=1524460 RepID=UPI0024A986C9